MTSTNRQTTIIYNTSRKENNFVHLENSTLNIQYHHNPIIHIYGNTQA